MAEDFRDFSPRSVTCVAFTALSWQTLKTESEMEEAAYLTADEKQRVAEKA